MFTALSLFTGYLFLLGRATGSGFKLKGSLFEQAALTMGLGLIVNHCLVLTGLTFPRVFTLGLILGLWGAYGLWTDVRTLRKRVGYKRTTILSVCGITYLLAVYYLEILSEPLLHWDARSIWFFQAKMIWAEGALREGAGWNHPSLFFSHPDYPKMVPAIAAQLAYLKGYWNEYLPKGSLLVMLIPPTLWVASFRKSTVSFVLVLFTFFFSLGAWLWNGYMDGYLAIYCAVALLLFGRYLAQGRSDDLYSGICALGIAACIKNEGLLFGLCVISTFLLLSAIFSELNLRHFRSRIRSDSALQKVLLLSIAPTLMWTFWKSAWGLRNDLMGAPWDGLSRISTRLQDGFTPQYVFNFLVVRAAAMWMIVAVLALIAIFHARRSLRVPRAAIVAAVSSALYVSGLYIAYLSTPHDLTFHLMTSAARTMATASMAMVVGVFFLLSSLEAHGRARTQRTPARADATIRAGDS